MPPLLEIDVDARELLAALDRLGDKIEAQVKAAALETAHAIAEEARGRVARSTGPGGGQTARNITATDRLPTWYGGAPDDDPSAYVYVEAIGRPANLALWLEFGTKYMVARPFLFTSARLEETNHLRRIAEAVQRAINAEGLGA